MALRGAGNANRFSIDRSGTCAFDFAPCWLDFAHQDDEVGTLADHGWRFALHSWTLGVGTAAETIAAAGAAGYDAIELNWQEFEAVSRSQFVDTVRGLLDRTELAVAVVGIKPGWMFPDGSEGADRLAGFANSCQIARSLGCRLVMSAVGAIDGTDENAIANLRAALTIARDHGLTLALEPNVQHPRLNAPQPLMRLIERAGGPCGIVLDSYHLHRAGVRVGDLPDIPASAIALVQVSDVSATPAVRPQPLTDRLLPGEGNVDWAAFFGFLRDKGYRGHVSLEAPNPDYWSAVPQLVARRGLDALRRLSRAEPTRP
jgi:sugar phosphate isomerase/epimerase